MAAVPSPLIPSPIPTGLLVLHSNRSETLAETVAAWLSRQPLGPLEEETLLVQSNGMAEWLKMNLAQKVGVCAATRVELPARFQWRLYRNVLGRDQVPRHSPLDKSALAWRLMRMLPALAKQPGYEAIAGFLREGDAARLLQLSERLADLLDQYQVYRPDWLEAWEQSGRSLAAQAEGGDVLLDGRGQKHVLPLDQRWQPALWRELLGTLSAEQQLTLRPELHRQVLKRLHESATDDNSSAAWKRQLPRRVVLFGMTHVPLPMLELLTAVSAHAQVILAVPNPCRFHWADIIDGREMLRQQRRRQPLREGRDLSAISLEALHAHAHPLLASWGRQGRDFVRQLDAFDDAEMARARFALPRLDLFDEEPAEQGMPWLAQVQAHIRDLTPLPEHRHLPLSRDDRSIVFHRAHSMVRELEVLHDELLKLLAQPAIDGRTLAPRDIVVMVPDIEPAAPAIRAVFGQYRRGDSRHIPFDIADLGARDSSPMVVALSWLLCLPIQRFNASELRDLLEVPALARRFGLKPESHAVLARWMEGAGLRWGLSEKQREVLGLEACGDTHAACWAMRRMLLGYAGGFNAADFAGIEPYGEVGGLEAEWVGGLAQLLESLAHWWTWLQTDARPVDWAQRGRDLIQAFFSPLDDEERQVAQALDEALTRWLSDCAVAQFDESIPLSVAREAWLSALEEPSLDRRFRAGGITFCTLMPMRAIPFEVVCLLGMNEGDYPRRSPRSDFDLMGIPGQARPGDRSRRDDDRQLMLEALLSARRVLYVSWTGRHVRDNTEQPPSVLVDQLRDYLKAGWSEEEVKTRTTDHPLQPFSRRYFEESGTLKTFAKEWRTAHSDELSPPHSVAEPLSPRTAITPWPADASERVVLSLTDLARFLRHPVRTWFRNALQVVFDEADEAAEDDEHFTLDGLQAHQVMDKLITSLKSDLQAMLADETHVVATSAPTDSIVSQLVEKRVQQARRRGDLPLGGLGDRTAEELNATVKDMAMQWLTQVRAWPVALAPALVEQALDHSVLRDWVDGWRGDGVPLAGEPGALSAPAAERIFLLWMPQKITQPKGKKPVPRPEVLLGPWLRAVAAAAVGSPTKVVVIGRDAVMTLPAPVEDAKKAQALLQKMQEAWEEGQTRPLPAAMRSGMAVLGKGSGAQAVYEGSFQQRGEVEDPCLQRTYPDWASLTRDEEFLEWAKTLWEPVMAWAGSLTVTVDLLGVDADEDEGAEA